MIDIDHFHFSNRLTTHEKQTDVKKCKKNPFKKNCPVSVKLLPCKSFPSGFSRLPFRVSVSCLFLVGLGLGFVLGPLFPYALESGVTSGLTEEVVGASLDGGRHVALLDLGDTLADVDDGQCGANAGHDLGLAEVDILAVTGLGVLGALPGEDDQALLVGLEAGDVGGEGLFAEVLAAEVDGDTDGGSHKAGNTSLL